MNRTTLMQFFLVFVALLPWAVVAFLDDHLMSQKAPYFFIATNVFAWCLIVLLHRPSKLPRTLDLVEDGLGLVALVAGAMFMVGRIVYPDDTAFRAIGLLFSVSVNPVLLVFGQVIGARTAQERRKGASM